MCRRFESHPSSSFFFSEKKELFGLVVLPFFLFIGLRVFMCGCVPGEALKQCSAANPADIYVLFVHVRIAKCTAN